MDVLTAELTVSMLAEILREPEKALLGRVLKTIGQERCAQVLAATLEVEANGGMMLRDGSRRKSPGGVFFQLTKNACTGKERYYLFRHTPAKRPSASGKPSAPSRHGQAPPAPALPPLSLTLDLWKGLRPMAVTATLKLVLRDLPETRERDGMVYLALRNEPRGVPQNIHLDSGPLYLTGPAKQWKTAITRAEEIRATGIPALLIVEAHVSTKDGAIIGAVKTVQVVEGKVPAQTASTS